MEIRHIGRSSLWERHALKSEKGVMWSEIHPRSSIESSPQFGLFTPPSALIGQRNMRYTGAIEDIMCSNACRMRSGRTWVPWPITTLPASVPQV